MSTPTYPAFNGTGWPVIRTPQWRTIAQVADSGKEYRLWCWQSPKWKWTVDWNYLLGDNLYPAFATPTAQNQLLAFYNQLQGQYGTFQYQDPNDNAQAAQVAIAVGDGVTKVFPLFRNYQYGAYAFNESVQMLGGAPTANIYINSVLQGTGTYTLTQPPATVTFSSAPGLGLAISWSANATPGFYFLCRFIKDSVDFSQDFNGIWTVKKLEFQSVLA